MPILGGSVSDYGEIRLLSELMLNDVEGDINKEPGDCARIEIPSKRLLWSIDPCPKPVAHWLGLGTPDVWGCYTATINLSDIAACGGSPIGMLVSLEMPDNTPISFVKEFQAGLISTLRASGTCLLGGNVKSAKKFNATGTVIGYEGDICITRSIDCTEGSVYLVGDSGDFWGAIIGNHYGWGKTPIKVQRALNEALCFPKAQTEAGRILGHLPFKIACMDCSDGLANALFQMARMNSLDITMIDEKNWPLRKDCVRLLKENDIKIENACYQFGDWQLLCIVPAPNRNVFEEALHEYNCTKIGYALQGGGSVFHEDGRRLSNSSLNQNFSGGYNSIESTEKLISTFMRTPVFV